MKNKNKKVYESPALSVTTIETSDIMIISGNLASVKSPLGMGEIKWSEMIEIDLQ